MSSLTIAIVQTQQFWEDQAKNIQHISALLKSQIHSKVDLILLPEMFNTGFTMNVEELHETMEGSSIQQLRDWSNEYETTIAATLIIKEKGDFYNRQVWVKKGQLITFYDKKHLFTMANEHLHFTPGKKKVITVLNGFKILLQTCYDLRFPVFSRNKRINGERDYDVIVYLANWPARRAYAWTNLLQARSIENQAYCIGVNRVGEDGNGISYSGGSAAYNPWGMNTLNFNENEEGVKILSITMTDLDEIDSKFPALNDGDSFDLH